MWRASVLTIFPEMFPGPLGTSLAGKALIAGTWSLDVADIRSFTTDKHRTVDDTPAGGGPGMVMKADVLSRAIDTITTDARPRLLMSPRGTPLTQARIEALTQSEGVSIVCARFEGIDERVIAARRSVRCLPAGLKAAEFARCSTAATRIFITFRSANMTGFFRIWSKPPGRTR